MLVPNLGLAETPATIKPGPGRRFLLFNVSRLCNQNCPFCWTSETLSLIRRQATRESIDWLTDRTLLALLSRFKRTGGDVLAVMSEGEPLVGINYEFMKKLAHATGALDLGLLVFTNGELLTKTTLTDLSRMNARTSFSISVNGGSPAVYDRMQGKPGAFGKVMANKSAWGEHVKEKPGHVAIHTVITSASSEKEMQLIEQLVTDLGKVPWIVSTMGSAGSARIHPEIRPEEETVQELVKKYATGPTATSSEEKT